MISKEAKPALAPIRFLKQSIALIAGAAVGAYARIKRLFVAAPTESELRQDEKAKQRDIRRELRGLAPEADEPKDRP